MKSQLLKTMSVLLLTAFTAMANAGVRPENSYSFIGKQWKMTSIFTTPAIRDYDGDGVKDQEVLNSLQPEQRNKIIIFKENGLVEERHIDEKGDLRIIKNGNWKKNPENDTFTWFLPNGTSLKGMNKNDNLVLEYNDGNFEIKYTLSLIAL